MISNEQQEVMSNLITAAEWARECKRAGGHGQSIGRFSDALCVSCAEHYAQRRVETWQTKVRTEKLPCGHPSFYMCGQGACGFCAEIIERMEAFRERAAQVIAEKWATCRHEFCAPFNSRDRVNWPCQIGVASAAAIRSLEP